MRALYVTIYILLSNALFIFLNILIRGTSFSNTAAYMLPRNAAWRWSVNLPGRKEVHGHGDTAGSRAENHSPGQRSGRGHRRCRSAAAAARVQESSPNASSFHSRRHHHHHHHHHCLEAAIVERREPLISCRRQLLFLRSPRFPSQTRDVDRRGGACPRR